MLFPPNKTPHLAKDIWERDRLRIEKIKTVGYDVKVVWESDYRSNPKKVVQECLEFLN